MFEFDMIVSDDPFGIAKEVSHQIWCAGHQNYIHYEPELLIEIDGVLHQITIDYCKNKIIVSSKH